MSNLITTKKSFIEKSKGAMIKRTQVGGITLDEWDNYVSEVKKSLISQGCSESDILVTNTSLNIRSSGQFVMKPKTPRNLVGKMVFRSKDFYFESENGESEPIKSFGPISNLVLVDGNLELTTLNGSKIIYSII